MAELSQLLRRGRLEILVSSTRKPISYINLAKRFLQEHGEVQLSALGIAIAPMVTVAEILKNRGLAVEKRISTALESLSDDYRTRQKPNMEIVLMKSPDFDDIIAQENLPGRSTGADAEDLVSELDGVRIGGGGVPPEDDDEKNDQQQQQQHHHQQQQQQQPQATEAAVHN